MCELCCGKAENNGKLDKGKRLSFCKTSRFSIEENIKNYITLKNMAVVPYERRRNE